MKLKRYSHCTLVPLTRQNVFSDWLKLLYDKLSQSNPHTADAISLPAVQTICSLSLWVLVFRSAYHYLSRPHQDVHSLLQITFDGRIYLAVYALSAEQSKLQLTQSTSDNAILTEYAMRFHNLTSGVDSMGQRGARAPHFYKCLGMGEAPWVEEQQTRN